MLHTLQKVALYEPPLPVNDEDSPLAWVSRYDQEIAKGDLAAAMVSVLKGTDDSPMVMVPPEALTMFSTSWRMRGGVIPRAGRSEY